MMQTKVNSTSDNLMLLFLTKIKKYFIGCVATFINFDVWQQGFWLLFVMIVTDGVQLVTSSSIDTADTDKT